MDSLLILAADPAAWAALLTLVVMEIVLGIDNLIFISILSNKLPEAQRARTQRLGIMLALVLRRVDRAADRARCDVARPRVFVARPDLAWWRSVPGLEGNE
jgi:hypothetical protein